MNRDNYCFLIPIYNHGYLLNETISEISKHNLRIIIIDDGSDENTKKYLKDMAEKYKNLVEIITNKTNRGKGYAFKLGIEYCKEQQIKYALQIDADNQHDTNAIEDFLNLSFANENYLIGSYPVYDDSVPAIRKYGRKISNFLVAIETLSLDVKDALLGFRIYPVDATYKAIKTFSIAKRMAFDIDIIVRLHRLGVRMKFLPLNVTYPSNGLSHFKLVKDNIFIALKHAELIITMLLSFPIILLKNRRG